MTPRFVVLTASAHMPNRCWGVYRRVAVVETDERGLPAMISPRARHCVRIVRTWERCHYGRTPKGNTAFERASCEAEQLADELNARRRLAARRAFWDFTP
jgi:hypothetical protein